MRGTGSGRSALDAPEGRVYNVCVPIYLERYISFHKEELTNSLNDTGVHTIMESYIENQSLKI